VSTYCSSSAFTDPDNCSQYLNSAKLQTKLETECVGKNHCQILKLNQFVDIPVGKESSTCFGDGSQLFVQVGCELPEATIASRQKAGLLFACAAVFIALFVTNYFDFIKKVQANDYVQWDINTITAGDYSIEFDIDPDFFNDY